MLEEQIEQHRLQQRSQMRFLALLAEYKDVVEEWIESGFIQEFLGFYSELSEHGGFRQWLDHYIESQDPDCSSCTEKKVALLQRLLFEGSRAPIWDMLERFVELHRDRNTLLEDIRYLTTEQQGETQ